MTNDNSAAVIREKLLLLKQSAPLKPEFGLATPVLSVRGTVRNPCWRLIACLAGSRRYLHADGKRIVDRRIRPREILLLEPFAGTWCEENGDFDHFSIVCAPDMLRFVSKRRRPGDPEKHEPDFTCQVASPDCDSLGQLMTVAAGFTAAGHAGSAERIMEIVLDECIASLENPTFIRNGASRCLLMNIIEYIAAHLDAPLDCTTIAGQFRISPNYVAQLFRRHLSRGFSEYLTEQRMELARRLLDGGKFNVGETAGLCGYRQPDYFIRVFSRHFGMTPLKWRNRKFQTAMPQDGK